MKISIRPLESSIEPQLFEASRESIAEAYPWMPWCHPNYSLDDTRTWIDSQSKAWQDKEAFSFSIISEDGRLLGGCGLNSLNSIHRFCNLGYWVRTSVVGQGVATQAVKILADWAFENTDLERLEILVAVENLASQRVAEKVGAFREGILRSRLELHGKYTDAFMNSITRSTWCSASE